MRDDGRYGRRSQRAWLFHHADDCIVDWCMWTAADLDIYVFSEGTISYGYFFISDLSGKLDSDFYSACCVFYCCEEKA